MNTFVARHLPVPKEPRQALQRSSAVPAAASSRSSPSGWIERLADWSDRQPAHHRVGSWVLYR